jgi:multidrug resistance efflux pump
VLAALDDRELKLEWLAPQRARGAAQAIPLAMAEHNQAQVLIVSAQLEQTRAQIDRVEDQLQRTLVTAPFDGMIASGDLSQSLGAPVERGTVLYEVAPLSSFRVIVKVDERDIGDVKEGQRGNILLSAFPHDPIPFQVEKITPVSTAKEGRNYFRVEAKLDSDEARLRPGMEGVGKIEVDTRRYAWIWTHQALDSLRLMIWTWVP